MIQKAPIGVFDSGYGGLTILREFINTLPDYDYLYLGDNARAPYGSRSFDIVYRFTLEAVNHLFSQGCKLVILACNTASAKALRSIQQRVLPISHPHRRVLGVIRPTVEALPTFTKSGHIGIFATPGTIQSQSYDLEVAKFFPDFKVTGHACPMWVPLVENREAGSPGADYFVKQEIDAILEADPLIDTIILGCTHYPLLLDKIRKYTPAHITVVPQGNIVAKSLADYLKRHPEINQHCSTNGQRTFITTENPQRFSASASLFLAQPIAATQIEL